MTIALATSELTGFSCELVLYGVLTVLTVVSAYVLVFSRQSERINWPMVVFTSLMFILCTAHVAVTGQRIFDAFIPGDPVARNKILKSVILPLYSAKNAIFFIMLIFGDIIVIYRCYLVWSKRILVVVVPIFLSIASAVLAFWAVWATAHSKEKNAVVVLLHAKQWGTTLFTLSLVANLWAVIGIAYRIISYEWGFAESQRINSFQAVRPSFIPIANIIIESGALNAAFLIGYTAVLDRVPSVLAVMADCAPSVVGIVFNLVIIRTGINPKRDRELSNNSQILTTLVYRKNDSQGTRAATTTTLTGSGGDRSIALNKYVTGDEDLELGRMKFGSNDLHEI